jgi:hypothetical protein
VFGWDDQLGTWWAQLWRDGSRSVSPDVWIADAGGEISELVRMVSERAGVGFDVADWALAESLRPPPETDLAARPCGVDAALDGELGSC